MKYSKILLLFAIATMPLGVEAWGRSERETLKRKITGDPVTIDPVTGGTVAVEEAAVGEVPVVPPVKPPADAAVTALMSAQQTYMTVTPQKEDKGTNTGAATTPTRFVGENIMVNLSEKCASQLSWGIQQRRIIGAGNFKCQTSYVNTRKDINADNFVRRIAELYYLFNYYKILTNTMASRIKTAITNADTYVKGLGVAGEKEYAAMRLLINKVKDRADGKIPASWFDEKLAYYLPS